MEQKETIVFFLVESVGHVNPLISILGELQRRGFNLIILTIGPLTMAPKLKKLGFIVEVVNESLDDSEQVRGGLMEDLDRYRNGAL